MTEVMMYSWKNAETCCGCEACAQICPVGAITMVPDQEGFLIPKIQQSVCVKCGACEKVCGFKKLNKSNREYEQIYYAARINDNDILRESSSGGIFSALSDDILDRGGIVFGAGYINKYEVACCSSETKEKRDMLRGSKYVQSKICGAYRSVEEMLRNQKCVMFSGTPCQIDGLNSYLRYKNVSTEKLYTMDFVCHGVASPMILRKYCDFIEKVSGQKICSINMRSKIYGWRRQQAYIKYENGNKHPEECYPYNKLYFTLLGTRKSCFECPYTSYTRCSDITVGDLWGISPKSKMDDDRGVSTVIINTEKGEKWFESIKGKIEYEKISKSDCYQVHLQFPSGKPVNRESFFDELKEKGMEKIFEKYVKKDTLIGKTIKRVSPLIRRLGLYEMAYKLYALFLGKGRTV